MPKTTFAPENKTNEATERYPRLKLEKDARGRICCVADPEYQWIHNLRAPKIVNGEAVIEIKKRRDSTTYETFEMEFIGNPICFGDLGILQDKGVDPKNCPACAASQRSDAVPGPVRRYAMNVVQYGIRPGGFELANPFSVRIVIWAFTGRRFDQLIDLAQEWGSLRDHDLLLGPCEDANYQKWDWKIAQQAAWQIDATTKQTVATAWEGRGTDADLEAACGRRAPSMDWLTEDVKRTEQRWAMARNAGAATAGQGSLVAAAPTLAAGLEDLLGGTSTTTNGAPAADPFSGAPAQPADPFAASPAASAGPATASDPFAGSAAPAPSAEQVTTSPTTTSDPFAATPASDTTSTTAPSASETPAPAPAQSAAAPGSPSEAKPDVSFDELLG